MTTDAKTTQKAREGRGGGFLRKAIFGAPYCIAALFLRAGR
jgi:hypothetical protein